MFPSRYYDIYQLYNNKVQKRRAFDLKFGTRIFVDGRYVWRNRWTSVLLAKY